MFMLIVSYFIGVVVGMVLAEVLRFARGLE